ncbi:MAG: DNA-protecting protein DprA [Candidatus Kapaibacterium sp.]|nr:MAG: DNA-protecting protein DprA [Candidatus Kapabacteria bacterium]
MWSQSEILALSLVPKMRSVDLRRFVDEYASLTALLHAAPPEVRKAKILDHVASLALPDVSAIPQNELFTDTEQSYSPKLRSLSSVYDELMSQAHEQERVCALEDVQLVSFWSEGYPELLKQIFYPPSLLFVRGSIDALSGGSEQSEQSNPLHIGIVGTRHCTDYGRMAAEQYARCFAEAGIAVVSGLATGIDTFSHKASLRAGGVTISVIASGIDKISPQISASLAKEISNERGAVVSEYPCGTVAQRAYFPRRNRIITGLSNAILVVESGERGGSLITARFAHDENRELFAIPGRIYSERSKGANMLIQRSEARLTLHPHDMLQALGVDFTSAEQPNTASELDEGEKKVYQALSGDPIHIETIAERTGYAVQDLLFLLLQLEFRGLVRQMAGKQFMRLGT